MAKIECPTCHSTENWKDGKRKTDFGSIQRYQCIDCGYRFSEKLNNGCTGIKDSQICAKEAKNLGFRPRKHVGTGEVTPEIQAMLTVFEGWLKKEGYKPNCYPKNVKTLAYLGADLMNPEDVKEKIAVHNVKRQMKRNLTYSYEAFLTMNDMTWKRPRYKKEKSENAPPFIPETSELEQLIVAAQSKRMKAYLQTLKETFADPGEALAIEWKEIAGKIVNINHPVKDHLTGGYEASEQLMAMLSVLPHDSERVFSCSYKAMSVAFNNLKKRVAKDNKNDRFLAVELRSFRHWGGTQIAELSNGNLFSVMKYLRHSSPNSSMKYINIWKLSFKAETQYEYMEVTTPEELKAALLGGYQHVIDKFGASWFRRAKRIALAGTPVGQREKLEQTGLEAVKNPSGYSETLEKSFISNNY
ncbi:MAG: hypothetical protein NWF01_08805 [Candidatus Bathyarchaeota archaeon]|nr:hypothetical protein [Candidatus Bathyarchaeota archaeon]